MCKKCNDKKWYVEHYWTCEEQGDCSNDCVMKECECKNGRSD